MASKCILEKISARQGVVMTGGNHAQSPAYLLFSTCGATPPVGRPDGGRCFSPCLPPSMLVSLTPRGGDAAPESRSSILGAMARKNDVIVPNYEHAIVHLETKTGGTGWFEGLDRLASGQPFERTSSERRHMYDRHHNRPWKRLHCSSNTYKLNVCASPAIFWIATTLSLIRTSHYVARRSQG